MRLFYIITLLSFSVLSCQNSNSKGKSLVTEKNIAIVIHGGAGGIQRDRINEQYQKAYEATLREALTAGYSILEKGGSSLEAIQAAIITMEDSPLFNAGKGAVFNSEGKQEMDASIMDGKTLNAGAVAGVRHIKNPILAARVVMDSSKHVMLSGEGAEILAQKFGLEFADSSYFFTNKRYKQLLKIQGKDTTKLDHSTGQLIESYHIDDHKYGTVGAGTSTGGMTNKKYGRIGDSPIIGAGNYANNLTCGISCTGTGEYYIRTVAAHEVSSLILYKGLSLLEAMHEVTFNQIGKLGGQGGMVGLDKNGTIAWDFNSTGMFRGYKSSNGKTVVEMFEK